MHLKHRAGLAGAQRNAKQHDPAGLEASGLSSQKKLVISGTKSSAAQSIYASLNVNVINGSGIGRKVKQIKGVACEEYMDPRAISQGEYTCTLNDVSGNIVTERTGYLLKGWGGRDEEMSLAARLFQQLQIDPVKGTRLGERVKSLPGVTCAEFIDPVAISLGEYVCRLAR